MLKEEQLFETVDKVKIAIERLKTFEPPEGYYLAFSGGKDSCVIKQLAIESGVKFDSHYSVTTIDPPDLIYFIKEHHKDVVWERPEKAFLTRMVEKATIPSRMCRWCCEEYKERKPNATGRLIVTGIRKAESKRRSKRKMVEQCLRDKSQRFLHCIIDWLDEDVWEYIKDRELPYCKLYDEGWKRIGCLMCPMTTKENRLKEIKRYPSYEKQFKKAVTKVYSKAKNRSPFFRKIKNPQELWEWWLTGKGNKESNELWLFEG